MKDSIKIIVVLLIIVFTNILGHYFAPTSIMLSPFTIGVLTILLLFLNIKMGYRILSIILAIIINDMSIKTFAGGTHDLEGAGWINGSLIIGLIISTIVIITKTVSLQNTDSFVKVTLILIMPITMYLYIQYFGLYGLSYSKSVSETKQVAIKNKTFLTDLNFSDTEIVYGSDSIHFISGWIEKKFNINHKSLIRETKETEYVNYLITIKHNLKPSDLSIWYKINSDDVNGSSLLDSLLQFETHKSDSVMLTIFKLKNGSVQNSTIIGRVMVEPK